MSSYSIMKMVILLCLFLVGCQPENSGNLKIVENKQQVFGRPFFGSWSGVAQGTVIAPKLSCEKIQLTIAPGSSPNSISISELKGKCSGKNLSLESVSLKIREKKVYIESDDVGQSSSFSNWSSDDGRWFTFRAQAPEISETKLYIGLVYFSNEAGGSLMFGVSLNPDGSDTVLVGTLLPIQLGLGK